ncbi:MAG TPA: sulfatase-like hydrolase/transferase [Vicinamibacteria bacterium]|nr:sulfatase-like hydrolase/transferase [Vicinamibacteria bacterium]
MAGGLVPLSTSDVATPQLERLAARGRRFDQAFSAYPSATFARAAILSGKRPSAWGFQPRRLADSTTLPAAFARGGYETVRVGSLLGGAEEGVVPWSAVRPAAGIEAAMQQVEQALARSTRPLFLVAGLDQPTLPAPVLTRFPVEAQRPEPAVLAARPRVAIAAGMLARPGGVTQPVPRPEGQRKQLLAEGRARLALLDASLKSLLDHLDNTERWRRTVVVLVGDWVASAGEHGLLERADTLFDATLRVPLLVAAPGLARPGAATSSLAEALDLFPTLLALAGLPAQTGVAGASLRPLLEDPGRTLHRSVLSEAKREVAPLGRSVRTARYRYTEWPDGSQELYDHGSDPGEWRNLALEPGHRAVVVELQAQLKEGVSAAGPATPRGPAPRPRRNVLLIVSDDMSVRLGAYGYPVLTPNIDRLARRGRRFEYAYAPVSVCSPSRTSLLTGLGPERHGVWSNSQPVRERLGGAVPLNEAFSASGYYTARVGKVFHQRWDEQFAWDLAVQGGEEEAATAPESRRDARRARRAEGRERARLEEQDEFEADDLSKLWFVDPGGDEEQPDAARAARVARLLEEPRGRPFFIALGLAKPHLRWVFPKRYLDLYPLDRIALTAEPADDARDIPAIAVGRSERNPPGLLGIPVTAFPEDARRRAIAAHNACVSFVDAQVGRVLDVLDRRGLWEATTVVLLGDHGFHLGEHGGIWGKDTLFEESLRVPLIVASPEVAQPGVPARGLVELVDVFPTLIELAGLPDPPQRLDGRSLVPMLKDPSYPGRSAAYSWRRTAVGPAGRSIRTDRYRYTEWPDGSVELYDLHGVGIEGQNLAGVAAHATTRDRLRALLREKP